MLFGDVEEPPPVEGDQGEGRQRHDLDRRTQPVEQRVLGPRVATGQQAQGCAVASNHGVATEHHVPPAHRHILRLHDLPGVGRRHVTARDEAVELVVIDPSEEGKAAQRCREFVMVVTGDGRRDRSGDESGPHRQCSMTELGRPVSPWW